MNKTTEKKMLIMLAVVCVVCITVMAVVLIRGQRTVVRFDTPGFDSAAVYGQPLKPSDSYSTLDAKSYSVALCGEPLTDSNGVHLWLTNPAQNKVLIKVRILDVNGNILGESGLLHPGEYVENVRLSSPLEKSCDAILKIMSYEPGTYHSGGSVSLQIQLAAS